MRIDLLSTEKCTGCQLCKTVCPTCAISMVSDEEGFLQPIIDEKKCINCGICASKCPQLTSTFMLRPIRNIFAVQAKESICYSGSSGGVFGIAANHIIDNSGSVCGASFDIAQRYLAHQIVDNKEDLKGLFKSKYVQSDIGDSYSKIKELLEKDVPVLFCGCPCQVDALRQFLAKEYDKLITIDILCHGVPSPLAYQLYLDEISKQNQTKKIVSVDFRSKKRGWGISLEILFEDSSTYTEKVTGPYMEAFLTGLNMRNSCFSCPYAREKRTGDITIGDFWGIRSYQKDWDNGKGTSFVSANSKKGADFIENIVRLNSHIFEEIPINSAIEICKKNNGAILKPTEKNIMRKCFFYHLVKDGFYLATRYAQKALMDVGILGWWIQTPTSNFGSTLTAYALGQYLFELGLSVAYISPPGFDREHAGPFNKRYSYRMTARYEKDQMSNNNQYFKTYIVGSDVLWYYDAMKSSAGYNFMLDFADYRNRKIAYATSFGNTKYFFPKKELPYAKYLLKRFDAISSREIHGVEVLKDRFEISDATQVVDPVFLCSMQNWNILANNAERKTEGNYIFAYFLDPDEFKVSVLKKLIDDSGYNSLVVVDRQYNSRSKETLLQQFQLLLDTSIEEFIYHLQNAKFVVTDSFHGTCFSLIFNRPFYSIPNIYRDTSRFDTLSDIFGISDRMISSNQLFNTNNHFDIDYLAINEKIEYHVNRSKKWLNDALFSNNPPQKDIPFGDSSNSLLSANNTEDIKTISLQVNKNIEDKAINVCRKLGISINDAFNIFLNQMISTSSIPALDLNTQDARKDED